MSITGATQVLVQAVGFISGIMIIRLLSTHEYALYTLANTMLGTMTILADGGISTGVMAEGGKVWADKKKLGIVLATGLDLRKKFAAITLTIALPLLLILLRSHGASWLMSILIIFSIIISFISVLSSTILEVAPKLKQDILPLQKNYILSNFGRLILLSATIFAFPVACTAIISSGLPQIWSNWKTRRIAEHYADWNQRPDVTIRAEILQKVKRMLPLAIYFCFSGQITVWLLSMFGSTTSIAQIGALGRFSVAMSIASAIFGVIAVPRYARLPNSKKLLLKWYATLNIILIIFSLIIISIAWLFPEQLLWILGKDYKNLTNEILIIITSSCLNLIASSSFSLYSHRGVVMRADIGIGIGILGLIVGLLIVDVSTLRGALYYSLFSAAYGFFVNIVYGLIQILHTKN